MTNNRPAFSVIIPVYNRAHLVATAIDSVLAQTFRDFEIVIVDDGSSDDLQSVVDAYRDPRIVFVRQKNAGGGAARNRGIDAARGRYVAFLDSDDRFLPHHLEQMHALLKGTTGVVGYARMIVDRGAGRTMMKPPRAIRSGEDMATYLFCDRGFVPTITVTLDRATAAKVRYNETIRVAEDADFAVRLFLAGCTFAMAERPGAIWLDVPDPNRISSGRKGAGLAKWLEAMRDEIPVRAYYGCRGWAYAKYVAKTDRRTALRLYLSAIAHRCYSPKLSFIVFLQIFLPDRVYRRLADTAIGWMSLNPRRKAPLPMAPEAAAHLDLAAQPKRGAALR